jgi:hypothetical protein
MIFSSNLSVCFLAVIFFLSGCAGLPVRGSVGGQNIETRVDSEAARYFLTSYLGGRRSDIDLDQRIDRTYRNGLGDLPDRIELKRLSDEFSVDFAALYFADRIARAPNNRDLRAAYARVYDDLQKTVAGTGFLSNELAAKYEIVLVPGYLYKRPPVTGADLAAPRAALRRAGIAQYFVETIEDGAIETNAEIVLSAIRARSQGGRRLVLVSVSKSGAEVALALTRLGSAGTGSVAAWVKIAGTLQGSPLADESLLQLEDVVGKVDVAGVESLSTARSRERFNGFRVPPHVLVINYIGIPLSGTISLLARSGFLQLRAHGPNDGLSLLPDLIIPGGVTLAELGRDHFLLDDRIDVSTIALTITVMSYLEQGWRPSQVLKMSDLDAIP